jgi:hypothetical protein
MRAEILTIKHPTCSFSGAGETNRFVSPKKETELGTLAAQAHT